jgi:hypothetical protein
MAKLVKFNCATSFRNIPDSKYKAECDKMEALAEDDMKKFGEAIAYQKTKFMLVDVKMGDEVSVPDWYYDAHKDDLVTMPISFDKYTDRNGSRIPFEMYEAQKHGDVQNAQQCTKQIKRFELIEQVKAAK